MRKLILLLALVLGAFTIAPLAQAAAPTVNTITKDPTFGTAGSVPVSLPGKSIARHLAWQSNGKLVVSARDNTTVRVQRINVDGSTDTSFGSNGSWSQTFSEHGEIVAMAVGADDAIYVALQSNESPFGVVKKLTANGQLDTTFGNQGKVDAPMTQVRDVIVAHGRVTVLGTLGIDPSAAPVGMIARFVLNGQPDAGFGANGVVATAATRTFGPFGVDANNRVIAFTGTEALDYQTKLIRINADGSTDPSYGGQLAKVDNLESTLALLPDGRVAVVTGNYSSGGYALQFYDASGTLSTRGPSVPNTVSGKLLRRADGTFVAAGYNKAYFNADGSIIAAAVNDASDSSYPVLDAQGRVLQINDSSKLSRYVVDPAALVPTITTSSLDNWKTGETRTVTIKVTSPDGPVPDGTVKVIGRGGVAIGGILGPSAYVESANVVNGVATFEIKGQSPGAATLDIEYFGAAHVGTAATTVTTEITPGPNDFLGWIWYFIMQFFKAIFGG